MRLILVRHGETVLNAEGRFSGQVDTPLTARGKWQALVLGHHLAATALDAVVASNLWRARATARAIVAHHGVPVAIDPSLRERSFGAWEGATFAEVRARNAELAEQWQANPLTTIPPGGESIQQVYARVVTAFDSWRRRFPAQTIVWVTHSGVIEVVLCYLLRLDLSRWRLFRQDNAAITDLDIQDQIVTLTRLNDTRHLNQSRG
jgi:broad specificity phosphatase PhoE